MAVPGLDDSTSAEDLVLRNTLASVSPLTRPFSNLQKEVSKLKAIALDTLLRNSAHTTPGHLLRRLAPTIISRAWTIRLIGLPKKGFLGMLRGFFAPDAS